MGNRLLTACFAFLLAGSAAGVLAQRATEQFIPIGKSPGLSAKVTVVGTIRSRDEGKKTITVGGPSGPRTARITDRTRIWLDRSSMKATNVQGTFADLKVGRRVECKYYDKDPKEALEWVKVQVSS
jgi:hypothetical protein